MYREAEEKINEGLNSFSRILLGSVPGLFGLMMVFIAPPTEKQIYFYFLGGFCLVISLACMFRGRVRQFLGSLIGVVLATLSVWYLSAQIFEDGPLFSARSDQSIFNAIMFAIFFGVPGFTYVAKTKFGFGNKRL